MSDIPEDLTRLRQLEKMWEICLLCDKGKYLGCCYISLKRASKEKFENPAEYSMSVHRDRERLILKGYYNCIMRAYWRNTEESASEFMARLQYFEESNDYMEYWDKYDKCYDAG
jgi:hypothetical protein